MSELTSGVISDQSSCIPPRGGFSFDNAHRNALIEQTVKQRQQQQQEEDHSSSISPSVLPTAMKTGTTIVGMVYKNGVILGADTRATAGSEVADKNCEKIHYLAPNIYCCGAGTAADTEKTTELIASQLELLRMSMGGGASQSRVITACTLLKRLLFRYQGYISAALVLGGCDAATGPHVYQIYPHGSTGRLPYTTMGSGSLAAISVFETDWHDDMSEEEGLALVRRAVSAGVFNDLGSGSNVDTCVVRTDGTVSMNRGDVKPNDVEPLRNGIRRSERLRMKKGVTAVLKSDFVPAKKPLVGGLTLEDVTVTEMET